MSSFAAGGTTVTFTHVDRESFSEQREGRVAIQEIPGGDEFTVDLGGRQPHKITVRTVLQNESAWGALFSVVGREGTLSIDTLDTHQAVLMTASREAPRVDGQISATAEFVVTD